MPVNSCGFWRGSNIHMLVLGMCVVIWIVNASIFLPIDDGYNFRRSHRSIVEAYSTTALLQMEHNSLIFSLSPEKLFLLLECSGYHWSYLTRITFYIQYWKYFKCITIWYRDIVRSLEYLLWMIFVFVFLYLARSIDFMQ